MAISLAKKKEVQFLSQQPQFKCPAASPGVARSCLPRVLLHSVVPVRVRVEAVAPAGAVSRPEEMLVLGDHGGIGGAVPSGQTQGLLEGNDGKTCS